MSYPWLTPLLAALATLVLAILVNRKGSRNELNQVFTFLATTMVFWNLNFFVLYSVSDRHVAFEVSRVLRSGVMFMTPAILHLCIALRNRPTRFWRNVLVLDYGVAAFLAVANAFDAVISDVRTVPWGFASIGTTFYNLFVVCAVVNCGGALALLAYEYRVSKEPRTRLQLKLWLVGAIIAIPLGQTNLLPAYGIPIYPLGHLGNAAWAAVVAYAIVRHRLMDVDVILTKGMAYAAVSFILIAPAFALALSLERLSFGRIHPDFSFALLLMFAIVGVLFPTLRLRAESRIGRMLFSEKYQHRAALSAFARSVVRILDRDRLVRELGSTLSETLGLENITVGMISENGQTITTQYIRGLAPSIQEFPSTHPFVLLLSESESAVLRDELEASSSAQRSKMQQVFVANGWEVCVPLTGSGNLVGFLALGPKRNLDAFFVEDLELLEAVAAQASVALENARLYEELGKSQDIIRRADRLSALGTLAAGIAHEVRNPLVSIQTFFQLAPERIHDEEFMTTFLGMTASEVKRIASLINELLSFARSPSRSLQPVDLGDSLTRVVALLEAEARKLQLTLTCSLPTDRIVAMADGDQLKQVLINLVLNAVQATPPGGTVVVSTRRVSHRQPSIAQIEIRDTGVGIPADRLEHIFDPFYTTKDKGTGLGLSIVHQIIAEHGGSISVESKEGHGTTFLVELPALEPNIGAAYGSTELLGVEPLAVHYRRGLAS